VAELLLLAVASAVYPLLLAIALIAIGAEHPRRLLAGFLAGGLLATMTVGLIVVHLLQSTSFLIGSHRQSNGVLPILIGAAAVVAAIVLAERRSRPPKPEAALAGSASGGSGRINRWLDHGAAVACAGGFLLNIVPGPFPIVALKDVAELHYSLVATAGILLVFYLIMFAFIELPLIGYFVAPDRTADAAHRFHAWLMMSLHRFGVYGLGVGGVYLIVRGVLTLAG
jgi:hypothetical protein